MISQRERTLRALERAGDGATAGQNHKDIDARYRAKDPRGTAQTLRRAAADGIVSTEGEGGKLRYRRATPVGL